jgi:Clp amino terminal domain, pathogenicity island component
MPNNKMERFTQRARRVLSLAQEESERLKHNYIGTEHLLLGLLREEGGVAGRVLRDLGLELHRVQDLVEELTDTTSRFPPVPAELSPGTKRVLELAVDEARRMGHHYIGTEHLILGLVRQSDGVAIDVLKRLDIRPEEVRRNTRRVLQESPVESAPPRPSPPQPPSEPPQTDPQLSEAYLLTKTMLTKLLDMLGEDKLTMQQVAEVFSVLVPEINLTSDDKARLIGQFFRPEQLEGHQVHFTITEVKSGAVSAAWKTSLEAVLHSMDRFLGAVLLTGVSAEVTFNEGDLRVVARIEKDEGKKDG